MLSSIAYPDIVYISFAAQNVNKLHYRISITLKTSASRHTAPKHRQAPKGIPLLPPDPFLLDTRAIRIIFARLLGHGWQVRVAESLGLAPTTLSDWLSKPLKRASQLAFFELIHRLQVGWAQAWRPITDGVGYAVADIAQGRIIARGIPDFETALAIANAPVILLAARKLRAHLMAKFGGDHENAIENGLNADPLAPALDWFRHGLEIAAGSPSKYDEWRGTPYEDEVIVFAERSRQVAIVSRGEIDPYCEYYTANIVIATPQLQRDARAACLQLMEMELDWSGDAEGGALLGDLRNAIDQVLGWRTGIDNAIHLARKPERICRDDAPFDKLAPQLVQPHVLNHVAQATGAVADEISLPRLDPDDGGLTARLLVLLPAAQPEDAMTGFFSIDNPGRLPPLLRAVLSVTGIERRDLIVWPLLPWAGPEYSKDAIDSLQHQGYDALGQLLDYLPNLTVAILMGRPAHTAAGILAERRPDVVTVKTAVPVWPKRDIPRIVQKFVLAAKLLTGEVSGAGILSASAALDQVTDDDGPP